MNRNSYRLFHLAILVRRAMWQMFNRQIHRDSPDLPSALSWRGIHHWWRQRRTASVAWTLRQKIGPQGSSFDPRSIRQHCLEIPFGAQSFEETRWLRKCRKIFQVQGGIPSILFRFGRDLPIGWRRIEVLCRCFRWCQGCPVPRRLFPLCAVAQSCLCDHMGSWNPLNDLALWELHNKLHGDQRLATGVFGSGRQQSASWIHHG